MTKILNLNEKSVAKALQQGKITITIAGLNYIGISLSALFADEGAKVIGCDTDPNIVDLVVKGKTDGTEHDLAWLMKQGVFGKKAELAKGLCPNCGVALLNFQGDILCPSCGMSVELDEKGAHIKGVSKKYNKVVEKSISLKKLLEKNIEQNKFKATTDVFNAFLKSDVAIITMDAVIGPPPDYPPDLSQLTDVCKSIGSALKKEDLVIIKGLVTPGTTEGLIRTILETQSRLKAGSQFGLAYMPERADGGNAVFELRTASKIIGGINQKSLDAASALFSIFPAEIYPAKSIKVAETAKLIEEVYSDVNLAFANELAMSCQKLGVDALDVIETINTRPRTHIPSPGPTGGKDGQKSLFLFNFQAIRSGYNPQLITWGHRINEHMPSQVLEMVKDAFGTMGLPIKESRVSVLGVSSKAGVSTIENSPSFQVIKALTEQGAKVAIHDPYANLDLVRIHLRDITSATRDIKDALKDANCAIVMVDHPEYRYLKPSDFAKKMKKQSSIIDAKRILIPKEVTKAGLIYMGTGYPSTPI